MTCPEKAELEAFLQGTLGNEEARAIDEHLVCCDACNAVLADLNKASLGPLAFPSSTISIAPTPPEIAGYKLLGQLGTGGMGAVWKAEQLRLKRLVAVKTIRAGHFASSAEIERFQVEAEAAARLHNPHIVPIYEAGTTTSGPYIVMELNEGGNLADQLKGALWSPQKAAELVAVLAQAVEHAHAQGVVHRDLKPKNVLFAADGSVKITDFGLAKLLDRRHSQSRTGEVFGTPSYMAPEQALGQIKRIGPATDVYALGAILYELLTGRPPFQDEDEQQTLEQVRHLEPVPPRRLRPRLPRDLDTITLKCLEKEPAQRYASAGRLAEDLQRFLEGRPITARWIGPVRRGWRWCRRRPIETSLVAALLLAIIGGLGGVFTANLQTIQAEQQRFLVERAKLRDEYVQSARLAAQRGDWRFALSQADEALAYGYPDGIGLHLTRVRAFFGLEDRPKAEQTIRQLLARPDLGSHEGSVVLLAADLALGKDTAEGLSQYERALILLPAEAVAEQSYARAMLASTTPQRLQQLEEALRHDSFHQRARVYAGLLALSLGRIPRAKEHIVVGRSHFPDAPEFLVLEAFAAAAEGNIARGKERLEQAQAQLRPAEVALLQDLLDYFFGRVGPALRSSLKGHEPPFLERMRLYSHALSLVPRITSSEVSLEKGFPPLVKDAFVKEFATAALLGKPPEGSLESFKKLVEVHPEGTLYCLLASLLFQQRHYVEAQEASRLALQTPSLFPIREPALMYAAFSEVALLKSTGLKKEPVPEMGTLAQQHFAELAGIQPTPDFEHLRGHVINVAIQCRAYGPARTFLSAWLQRTPDDPNLKLVSCQLDLAEDRYATVLTTARALLERFPDAKHATHQAARDLEEQAQAKLKATHETLNIR